MIQIIKGETNYLARYSGRDKDEIIHLFGTDILPTPYLVTSNSSIYRVADKIQNLNPGINVIVD